MEVHVSHPEQARASVDAILASETFSRSEQLRSFLTYVCERTLAGHGREINEYSVAVEALGKPAGFSPGEDSSVRRAAYDLRQKLQRYYESEGREATLHVELPKGSYTPRFVEAAYPPATATPEPAQPEAPPAQARPTGLILALAAMTLVCLVLGAGWYRSTGPRLEPALELAWRPLLAPGGDVLVSVGTTLHLIVRPYMNVVAEGLPKYPAPAELYPLFRSHRPLPQDVELSMHPVDNSVQMGHAQTVALVATTLALAGKPAQILPERSVSAPTLRGRNVILIADPQNSSLAAQRLESTPLTLEFDRERADLVVRERGGARTVWTARRGADRRYAEVLGLITVLPGEGETGGPHRNVIFSGITSVGTHGAAEFFTRPEALKALLERFRSEGLADFPTAYQVLVRCRSDDTQLLAAEYVAHRVITR